MVKIRVSSKEEALEIIRNFRQNLIIELKKDGIWLDSFDKIEDKATYIKKKYEKTKRS